MDMSEFHLELEALYASLEEKLRPFTGKKYTASNLSDAERDYNELKKLEREVKSHRKMMNREYGPRVDRSYEKALRQIDKRIKSCDAILREAEKARIEARRKEIAVTIAGAAPEIAGLAPLLARTSAFVENNWLRQSIGTSKLRKMQIEKKSKAVANNIALLCAGDKPYREALVLKYIETMDMEAVSEYAEQLRVITASLPTLPTRGKEEDNRPGSMLLSVSGAVGALCALEDDLQLLGLSVEMRSRTLPKEPSSLPTCPRSFVSVDLETTGSFGSKSGDLPAEITEIGAVKVIDGVIVEEFDLLVDPRRHITHASAKLTHITDDMVRGQPSVAEGLKQLDDFSKGLPWVGHDFLNNDMPLIRRASLPAGLDIGHEVFDTFLFASSHKELLPCEGLSLAALSQGFGIAHDRLHRAVDDARITALLALKLQEALDNLQ